MAIIEPDDPRLVFMPESAVVGANGTCNVMRDKFFCVHPEKGLVFWQLNRRRYGQLVGASPQCNTNKDIVISIRDKMYPWAEIKTFPIVLVPIDVSDYF